VKRIRATTHQAVLERLLKQPGFRQGYAREWEALITKMMLAPAEGSFTRTQLRKLSKLVQEPRGKTFSSMEVLLRDLKRR
jgi:hypothetical protein